jgi:hypothetical protein
MNEARDQALRNVYKNVSEEFGDPMDDEHYSEENGRRIVADYSNVLKFEGWVAYDTKARRMQGY